MGHAPYIAIVDFGSQYTHLIARNFRELGVETRIVRPRVATKNVRGVGGIILSGGPKSVLKNPIRYNPQLLTLPVPTLGLCYGHQLLAHALGGMVTPSTIREYGRARLRLTRPHPLLNGLPNLSTVWMSHGDSVTKLPAKFVTLASTATLRQAAVAHVSKPIFGLQFHPEVHHTQFGRTILQNFAFTICGLKPTTRRGLLQKITAEVRIQVGKKKVFLLVSGGVDSTVAFALLNRILGPSHVYGLHVDTGLMRLGESKQVQQALARAGFKNLRLVKAGTTFFKRLKRLTEPEAKRNMIGQTFLDVKAQLEKRLKLNARHWLLGQGTIYPDTIESGGTAHADKIKTHHNRIGILAHLAKQNLLVEPLKELYKDEVRQLGAELELPQELLWAHPFPGPGLGVRVLCLSAPEAKRLNSTEPPTIKVSGYPTRVLPLRSVGVQGDERSYRNPVAIDTPYATAAKLHRLATGLTNQHHSINRVLLKLVGPNLNDGTAHTAFLTPPRVKLLQQADAVVTQEIKRAKLYYKLWQCPVVLAPFGVRYGESLILRPFASREAMTGQAYLLPRSVIQRIIKRLERLKHFDFIFYDLTDKPPGTVEWE